MDNGKTKFNFAATFSLVVLLIYAYISFMGLVYWRQGDLLLPSVLTLGFILIVIGCLFVMSISKATRWKEFGMIGQCFFGLIILVAFVISAVPFTNFMGVLEKQDEIKTEINRSFLSAKQLNDAYTEYVNKRIAGYKEALSEASASKSIRPSVYNELLGGASGSSDEQKIVNLSNSLQQKLAPGSMSVIMEKRLAWLEGASQMSVLNMKLPSNLVKISKEVSNWTDNFRQLSKVIYKGENTSEFEYQDYNSKIETVTAFYTELHKPSFPVLLISLLGFGIMLLPYFVTLESNAGKRSNNDKMYE